VLLLNKRREGQWKRSRIRITDSRIGLQPGEREGIRDPKGDALHATDPGDVKPPSPANRNGGELASHFHRKKKRSEGNKDTRHARTKG